MAISAGPIGVSTPQWDGANLWSATTATVNAPSTLDRWVRPWGRFVAAFLILAIGLCRIDVDLAARAQRAVSWAMRPA